MNFARFSVTRPVAVTMRIAALVLIGAICLTRLPIDLLPIESAVAEHPEQQTVATADVENGGGLHHLGGDPVAPHRCLFAARPPRVFERTNLISIGHRRRRSRS